MKSIVSFLLQTLVTRETSLGLPWDWDLLHSCHQGNISGTGTYYTLVTRETSLGLPWDWDLLHSCHQGNISGTALGLGLITLLSPGKHLWDCPGTGTYYTLVTRETSLGLPWDWDLLHSCHQGNISGTTLGLITLLSPGKHCWDSPGTQLVHTPTT